MQHYTGVTGEPTNPRRSRLTSHRHPNIYPSASNTPMSRSGVQEMTPLVNGSPGLARRAVRPLPGATNGPLARSKSAEGSLFVSGTVTVIATTPGLNGVINRHSGRGGVRTPPPPPTAPPRLTTTPRVPEHGTIVSESRISARPPSLSSVEKARGASGPHVCGC